MQLLEEKNDNISAVINFEIIITLSLFSTKCQKLGLKNPNAVTNSLISDGGVGNRFIINDSSGAKKKVCH